MSATTLTDSPAPDALHPVPAERSFGRRVAAKVLLAVAVLLIATACTGRHPAPKSYGDPGSSVEKNFIKGCLSQNPGGSAEASQVLCQCQYDEVKKTIPFQEFADINSELSKNPAVLPPKFQAIIEKCKAAG